MGAWDWSQGDMSRYYTPKKKKKFQGSDYDLLRMGKTMNWGRKGCVSFNQRYENSF